MKVKTGTRFSGSAAATTNTSAIRLDKYPFEDNITLQLKISASFTGTITLQGRSHPDMGWFSIGAAIDPSVSGFDVIVTRSFAPEYRLQIAKTSVTSDSVDWWIGQ